MILLAFVALVRLSVPAVSSVDASANHGEDEYYSDGEGNETRKRQTGPLNAAGPGGLAILLAP